jgi:hypothetical protein
MWLVKVLLLAALPLGITSCGFKCPPGFELVGCKCYHLSTVKKNYFDAAKVCQGIGAKLAEPLDAREFQALRRKYVLVVKPNKLLNIWVGVNDIKHEKRYKCCFPL